MESPVLYEVWPHYEIADDERIMVSFDLELDGTHEHGQPSQDEIGLFDQSLHGSAGGRFEVLLLIQTEHRDGFFDPADACEGTMSPKRGSRNWRSSAFWSAPGLKVS